MKSAIYLDVEGRNTTVKQPATRIDYPFDFSELVENEGAEIVSYEITVAGVEPVADAQVGNIIYVTVEGGEIGVLASIKVLVTLGDAQSNRFQLDLFLKIKA